MLVADTLQCVTPSQKNRSSFSKAFLRASGHRHGHRRRQRHFLCPTQGADKGPQEYDYHFHETPLNLLESYFAESGQHHCTFGATNNPGRVVSGSPEPPEPDSSDDEDDDVTVVNQGDVIVAPGAKERGRVDVKKVGHSEPRLSIIPGSHEDDTESEASEGVIADSRYSEDCSEDDSEDSTNKPFEEDVNSKKPPFIPDDDLFKEQWCPDPWNRPPGQMWTREVQKQHNLRAAIREKGFTGERAAWLYHQLWKRKGYRFPFHERTSLKKPGQTATEYFSALKQRTEEEMSYQNQVKQYDEGKALEECRWAFDLYNTVYRPDWPDSAIKKFPSTATVTTTEDRLDGDCEEKSIPKGYKTRQHTSTPEPPNEQQLRAVSYGMTIPPLDQRASQQEIEQRNMDFRGHKAEVMEEARIKREKEEIEEFMQSADNQRFSNGYRERWKE